MQGPELITGLRVRDVTAPIVIVTEDTSPTTQLALTNKNIDVVNARLKDLRTEADRKRLSLSTAGVSRFLSD